MKNAIAKLRFLLWAVLVGLLLVHVWKIGLLVRDQADYVYYPERDWAFTPEAIGLSYEEVLFQSADGIELSGWLVKAENPQGTVLICHGNAGNISHRLDEIRMFHGLGLNVFIFDYRGYGHSQGTPTEEGTYQDAEAAWQYLTEERGIKPKEIVVAGRSLGAAIAAHLAVQKTPRALILESGFTSLPDMASELYPFYPVRFFLKFHYDTVEALKGVRCPVLVVHSRDDTLVPFDHGQRLFEAANPPKEFLEIHGPHNEGYAMSWGQYRQALLNFLERH